MTRIAALVFFVAIFAVAASGPPRGQASSASVDVSAVFLDATAQKTATGSDFSANYVVIEVTVTPKGNKPLIVSPDDFLLRIPSDADSSGPMAASQVLRAGGGLILHRSDQILMGIDRVNPQNTGVTAAQSGSDVAPDAVAALQSRMLSSKTTSSPVTGLLFFPFGKKKAGSVDLVYSAPDAKLHISFR